MRSHLLAVMITALLLLVIVPFTTDEVAPKVSDPPDGGGYRYTDAMDPEPKIDVSYLDVKGDPSAVGLDTSNYNAHIQVDIGFNFKYYGQTYNKIYIN